MKVPWRTELGHTCATAMEAAWVSPVLLLLSYSTDQPGVALIGLPLAVLLYAGRVATRWLLTADVDEGHTRLLLVYLTAASLIVTLKVQNYGSYSWRSADWLRQLAYDVTNLGTALGAIMLNGGTVFYAWWRGVRLGQSRQQPAYVVQQFQVGLTAVTLASFLGSRVGLGTVFMPWIFWFFLWGLVSIAVSRLDETARNRRAAVEPYWLPIVLTVTLLVLLGGGAISLLYSREVIAAVRTLLQPVGAALELLLFAIALPIGYLIEFLVWLLKPLLSPLIAELLRRLQEFRPPTSPAEQFLLPEEGEGVHLPLMLQETLKWLLIGLIVFALLMLLARSLRRRRHMDESGVEEIHESVWSLAELWTWLRAFWRRLLNRLGVHRPTALPRGKAALPAEEPAVRTVRQLYQRLLHLAASLGHVRPAAYTPYEYLTDLGALFAGSRAELALITEAYVQARYGGSVAGDEVLADALRAWQHIKDEGARIKEAQAAEARRQRAEKIARSLDRRPRP